MIKQVAFIFNFLHHLLYTGERTEKHIKNTREFSNILMYKFYLQRSCFNCFVAHDCELECLKALGDSHKQPKLPSVVCVKELLIGAFKTQSKGLGRWLIG